MTSSSNKRVHKIHESREFIVDSYPLFASLQRIVGEYEATLPIESKGITPPPPEQVVYYNRISSLYRQLILKQLTTIQGDSKLSLEEKETQLQHYSTMHSILSLTEILYFPTDGTGDGVVGEELLDWLNVIDRAPSAEEGTELSSLSQPWESPLFFPYLTRCLLRGHSSSLSALLELLISTHSSKTVQNLSKTFSKLYQEFPRSSNSQSFKTEFEFRKSLKNFNFLAKQSLSQVEKLYKELEQSSSSGEGGMEIEESQDFIQSFRTLFSILTLSTTTNNSETSSSSLVILSDQCETWQEYLITLLIYYQPLSTRQDLSTILSTIVFKEGGDGRWMIDQTLLEEKVQDYLFRGEVTKLLKTLVGVSPTEEGEEDGEDGEWLWLATHLIDLLSHLNLKAFDIPSTTNGFNSSSFMDTEEVEEESSLELLGPRESFLMSYSDSLLEFDQTLWRVCCEYWGECGQIGRKRISDLLTREQEELYDSPSSSEKEKGTTEGDGMDLEGEARRLKEMVNRKGKNVEEVLTVLGEYGMEQEMKNVCESFARTLIDQEKYGKALAYSIRAQDTLEISRIGFKILNTYVDKGQETFISHVDSLPTSLLRPPAQTGEAEEEEEVEMNEMMRFPLISFLSRYRDFLALYSLASQRANEQEGTGEAGDFEEVWRMKRQSSELLILLLTSGMAPKSFWAIILLDSVGLLETQPPLVSLSETYELLRIIEEITAPIQLSSSSSSDSNSNDSIVDIFGDLDMLGRLLEGREQDHPSNSNSGTKLRNGDRTKRALNQLEIVRGALARHLAICCCL
ncbi:hypothetical protein JCM3765_003395 [Sporobolomyces pararoseus]